MVLWKQLGISHKIGASLGLLVLLTAGMALAAWFNLSTIGAAVNGGVGAGVGAGIGAAASVIGVLVTRGNKTVVYPEDTLTFRLASPVTISTDGARFAFEPVRQQDYEAQRTVQPRRTVAAPPPVYGYPGYPGYYGYPPYWGPRVIIAGGRYGRRW